MALMEFGLTDMTDETNGNMTAGEVTRTLVRIERGVERIEQQMIPQVLEQVSSVRHRVANLEQVAVLKNEFIREFKEMQAVLQKKADQDAVDELERRTVAQDAVDAYRKWLLGAVVFAGGGMVISLLTLING